MTPENIKQIAKIAIPILLFIILFFVLYTITKTSKQDIEKQKTIQTQQNIYKQSDTPTYLVQL